MNLPLLFGTDFDRFDPRRIPSIAPNLKCWLKGNDRASVSQSPGSVSQWTDLSGNGNHATQGTSTNQPSTGTRQINGRNAIAFDGTNDLLVLSSALHNIPNGPSTIFSVVQLDSGGDNTQRIIFGQNATTGRYYNDYAVGAGGFTGNNNAAGTGGVSETKAKDSLPHLLVFTRNGSALTINVDGGSGGSSSTATNLTLTALYIGAQATNSNRLKGLIGEMMIVDALLGSDAINMVSRYLKREWNITSAVV